MDVINVFNDLQGATIVWMVLILAAADLIFGVLNGLKSHSFKSSINKNGVIIKCGCVFAIVFFYFLDCFLGLVNLGFSELFGATICISEFISIICNLQALGVPFPKSIIELLDKYTNENKQL